MKYACPNPTCRKMGCYDHCNTCGKDIFWRPPMLDAEIAYKGPKPLNRDGKVHRCMREGSPTGKYINSSGSTTYSKELYHFLKHGYGPQSYYSEQDIEAMKDPLVKAAWQKGVKDWLDKWERL